MLSRLVSPVLQPVAWRVGSVKYAAVTGGRYEPEASALFARFTTPPTAQRKGLINDLIKALKASGVWAKLDALYLFAAADAQAARRNWIADAYNAASGGSPTFVADRGFQGDGSAAYLTTGFNPATAGGKYTRNNAHLAVWRRLAPTGNSTDIGVSAIGPYPGSLMRGAGGAGSGFQLNSEPATISVPYALGHDIITRVDASNMTVYRAGSSLGTFPKASVAVTNLPFFLLALNYAGSALQFSNGQLSAASIGAGLTATEAAAFYGAIRTYLLALGATS